MKLITTIFSMLLSLVFFSSCQKNLDEFIPDTLAGPDTTWYPVVTSAMPVFSLRNNLLIEARKDSTDLINTPITVSAASGIQFTIPVNSFITAAGLPVTGRIYLQSILLKKRGEFIRMGIPTTSNGRLLVSGGAMFISAKKENTEVQLATNGRIYLHYNDNPVLINLRVFNSDQNPGAGFNWLPNPDTINNKVIAANTYYDVLSNRLQWVGCHSYIDSTSIAQTNISVRLPSNYTNSNTMVYVSFDDFRSIAALNSNYSARLFTSGRLPVGKHVTVVVLSKQADDYYLGYQQTITAVTSGTNGQQVVTITPVKKSIENIKQYLDNL
ncbi:MAG TPA: hypothetical protein VK498_08435 [Ferruginibacter sp.]|nr:hypothetical protein [Ferruginibacter sp.]